MTLTREEFSEEQKVYLSILKNLNQKFHRFRAGKVGKRYMIKQLVKVTNLNLLEILSLLKDFKNSKEGPYSILLNHRMLWSSQNRFDISSPDFDSLRTIRKRGKNANKNATKSSS